MFDPFSGSYRVARERFREAARAAAAATLPPPGRRSGAGRLRTGHRRGVGRCAEPAPRGGRLVGAPRRRRVLRVRRPARLAPPGPRRCGVDTGRHARRTPSRSQPVRASPGVAASTRATSTSTATSSMTAKPYAGTPEHYDLVHRLLNPPTPPSRFDPFRLQAIWAVRRHGLSALPECRCDGPVRASGRAVLRGARGGGGDPSRPRAVLGLDPRCGGAGPPGPAYGTR